MNPLTNIKRIYFIGIGGIGMSALARYFNTQGVIDLVTIKHLHR